MTNPIITLYDIPCKQEGVPWSPNTWKARYALNFKGVPYKTVWVEYPDIEGLCKKIGAKPTSTHNDGTPYYTLPVIHDPSTGSTISNSSHIAEYLDKTYPNKPILIPPPTRAFHTAFQEIFESKLCVARQFGIPKSAWNLNPVSEEFYRRTRLGLFGVSMEEMFPSGERKVVEWGKVREGFGIVDGWMRKEDLFVMGDRVSYADMIVAGFVMWLRVSFGVDSEEWKDIESWNEGRWARLMKNLEQYETVV